MSRIYHPLPKINCKWLRNRLTSAGLETVCSHIEKSCIASHYRQFSTNINIKIIKSIPVWLARAYSPFGANKIGFNFNDFSLQDPRKAVYSVHDAIQ